MKQKIILTVFLSAFAVMVGTTLRADSFRHEENIRKNAQTRALKAELLADGFASASAGRRSAIANKLDPDGEQASSRAIGAGPSRSGAFPGDVGSSGTLALADWADAQIDSAQSLPELKAALKKIHRKILKALPLN